jgi:hypothetical protein
MKYALIELYKGRSMVGVLPCGIISDEGKFWVCTNFLSGSYNERKYELGYKFSWVIQRELVFNEKIIIGELVCGEIPVHNSILIKEIKFNSELIVSDKLFNQLYEMELFCKKGDLKGSVKINIPNFEFKADGVIYYRIPYMQNPFNSFDVRGGEISYFMGVQEYKDNGKWLREGRQVMKASKFASMLECFYVGDPKLFKRMNELLAEKLKSCGKIDILISDDPASIYAIQEDKRSGTLASSCMRPNSSHGCKNYVDFYNTVGAKIAYSLDKEGLLIGRALLWENVKSPDGDFTFLDRIYGSESTILSFKDWAEDNGFFSKVEQSFNNLNLELGGKIICDYHYETDNYYEDFDGFPFVDTLCYYDGMFLNPNRGPDQMQSTEGAVNRYTCYDCGCDLDEDDIRWVDDNSYCSDCVVYCEDIGGYALNDDAVEVRDYYYLKENCFICACCGEWEINDNSIDSEDGDICRSCFEDKYSTCENCGDVVRHVLETPDNQYVCEYCYSDMVVECPDCGVKMMKDEVCECKIKENV